MAPCPAESDCGEIHASGISSSPPTSGFQRAKRVKRWTWSSVKVTSRMIRMPTSAQTRPSTA